MAGTTPIYGFPYPQPTDLVADYPALGQDLAQDIEAVLPGIGGLSPSSPTSIANSGGTATLTSNIVTFTTVSSVSLNGCFKSGFSNYRIIAELNPSTSQQIYWRVRNAGTDDTSNNYNYALLRGQSSGASGAVGTLTFGIFTGISTSGRISISCDLNSPFIATPTLGTSTAGAGGTVVETWSYNHGVSTAYDGFTMYPSTGTMTGTIAIYGYRK